MRHTLIALLALSLAACSVSREPYEGATITKTVSLIGIVNPNSIAIGPSYQMRAELGPECRSIIIGQTDLSLENLEALCHGEEND